MHIFALDCSDVVEQALVGSSTAIGKILGASPNSISVKDSEVENI